MKTNLNRFKKTTAAYILQVFAVIMLFGYAVLSPKKESKAGTEQEMTTLQVNKQLLLKATQDSLLNEQLTAFKKHLVKRW